MTDRSDAMRRLGAESCESCLRADVEIAERQVLQHAQVNLMHLHFETAKRKLCDACYLSTLVAGLTAWREPQEELA